MDITALIGQAAGQSPPFLAAFFFGLLTSISPCPLGANMAAIAFISKKAGSAAHSLVPSFSYTLGRSVTYTCFAMLSGFAGMAAASLFIPLQAYSDVVLALILAIAGFALLGKLNLSFNMINSDKLKFLADKGASGAFLLGAALALVLCPVSAALLLGGMLPLVVSTGDWFFIPVIYAIGTSLPVLIFAPVLGQVDGVGKKIDYLHDVGDRLTVLIGIIFLLGSAYLLLQYLL